MAGGKIISARFHLNSFVGKIILAGGEIILTGGEIILTGGEIQKKTQKRNLINRFTNTKPQIWK